MFCPNCGSEMPDGTLFCGNCGGKINAPVAESAAQGSLDPTYVEPVIPESAPVSPAVEPAVPAPVKKKKKKGLIALAIVIPLMLVLIAGGVLGYLYISQLQEDYEKAESLVEDKEYEKALKLFEDLGGYKDAKEQAEKLEKLEEDYLAAGKLLEDEKYEDALEAFLALEDYKDSEKQAKKLEQRAQALEAAEENYEEALSLMEEGKYDDAIELLLALEDYEDSEEKLSDCAYEAAMEALDDEDMEKALTYEEYMSEEKQEAFREEYNGKFADGTVLDDLEKALEARKKLAASDDFESYTELLDAELEYLKAYGKSSFLDEDLQELILDYLDALEGQQEALDNNGYVENYPDWCDANAERYRIFDELNEEYDFLENNKDLKEAYIGQGDYYAAVAVIERSLNEQLLYIAPEMDDAGNYYLGFENDTGYSFTLIYQQDYYNGEEYVTSADENSMEIPQGETVKVYVVFPDDSVAWDQWTIGWYYEDIAKGGSLV